MRRDRRVLGVGTQTSPLTWDSLVASMEHIQASIITPELDSALTQVEERPDQQHNLTPALLARMGGVDRASAVALAERRAADLANLNIAMFMAHEAMARRATHDRTTTRGQDEGGPVEATDASAAGATCHASTTSIRTNTNINTTTTNTTSPAVTATATAPTPPPPPPPESTSNSASSSTDTSTTTTSPSTSTSSTDTNTTSSRTSPSPSTTSTTSSATTTSRSGVAGSASSSQPHHAAHHAAAHHHPAAHHHHAAWRCLLRGNALEAARRQPWIPQQEIQQTNMYKQVFSPGFWPAGVGSSDNTPIFVVGMMRSGSTLVESILASHSSGRVFGMGEDSVFNGMLPQIRDSVVTTVATGDVGAVASQVNKYARQVSTAMRQKVPTDKQGTVDRVVDKMLFNFRNVGFIQLLFPNATIIHTQRAFHDVLWSCLKHKFDDLGLEWTFSVDHIVQFFNSYRTMMRHWEKVLPGRILHIQYEDLVAHPRQVSEEILAHCGLAWDDRVLEFYKSRRVVHTYSSNQVRSGIYTSAVNAAAAYDGWLKPLLDKSPTFTKHLAKPVRRDPNDWIFGGTAKTTAKPKDAPPPHT